MSAPFRDETAGLEARIRDARRELAELREATQLARARYQAARANLEGKFASQATTLEAADGRETFSPGTFRVGMLLGAMIGLIMWLPIIGAIWRNR
jgi:hypothetical protein